MKRFTIIVFIALIIVAAYSAAASSTGDAFPDMTARELKKLMDSDSEVFLLNPLADIIFNQGFIPGSVNIRWDKLEGSALLPKDKSAPIVTYCMGPR